jgi:hypothetical protein
LAIQAKNEVKARAGRLGARSKWDREAERNGTPTGQRIVRLDHLDPAVAQVIRSILAADRAAKEKAAAAPEEPATASRPEHGHARST